MICLIGYKVGLFNYTIAIYNDWVIKQGEEKIAYKVNFSFDEDTFPKERAFLKQYYEDEYGEYTRADIEARPEAADLFQLQLGIETYDIDEDGDQDILAYFQEHGLCGSRGCLFIIFRNDNGKYVNMFNQNGGGGVTVYNQVSILKNKTNGVHDIGFYDFSNFSIWKWNNAKQRYE